ncbi:MAG: GAF domain-containing protein [Pseudomonadota bacterium]
MSSSCIRLMADLEKTLSEAGPLERKLERFLTFSLDHLPVLATALAIWKKSWAISLLKKTGGEIVKGGYRSRDQVDFERWFKGGLEGYLNIHSIPVMDHKGIKGWLGVATESPLSKDETSFFEYFAARVAYLLSEAMPYTHSDRGKRSILINHIMMQLTKSSCIEDSVSRILSSFLDFLGKKSGAIYLISDTEDVFDLIAERDFIGQVEGFGNRLRKEETWLFEVMQKRMPRNTNGLVELGGSSGKKITSKNAGFVTGRPILQRGQEVGFFFVGNRRPFSEADEGKISFLTDQLVLFLDHFRLYRRLKDIGGSSSRGPSVEEISHMIVNEVAISLRAAAVWLMLYNTETHMLEMTAYQGLSKGEYDHLRIPPGKGIIGRVFESLAPVFIPDIRTDSDPACHLEEDGISSYLAVPLVYGGESIGVLAIFFPDTADDMSYEQEEIDLLTLLATQVAIAIENTRYTRELEDLKLEWASAFDSIPDIICILDREYRIIKSNKALALKFGVSLEEFLSEPCYRLIRNREIACEECPHRETLETGLPSYREWKQDGRIFLTLTSPIQAANGKTDKTVYFVKDITEDKEKEKRLQQYQKMAEVGTLVSRIAHDIRNPLGAIANSVSILGRFISNEGPQGQLLTIALEEIQRLKEMLSEFMEFARVPEPRPQSVNMVDVVEQALELLEEDEALMKGIVVEKHFETEDTVCSVDSSMIRSALWNLFSNAAEAMPNGGVLRISLGVCETGESEEVELQIRDTGVGIPRDIADRILEPFVTTKEKGTGLGLSIVYQIVLAHRGTINIEPASGGGTLVVLRLPTRNE